MRKIGLLLIISAMLIFESGAQEDSLERNYAEELPRIPPTSPDEALKTFEIHQDFELQRVAAEPLVTDPIAMAFDEFGRLFVVEMTGYSELRVEVPGGIRMLEDTDGDGIFDKSSRFVEGLPWPTAVTCYDGGIFVAAPPDILYCKDTDGDGKADIQELVFSGFGLQNVQGLVNTLKWGLDNQIHGATSSSGGTVTSVTKPEFAPVGLGGRDFSFNPVTRKLVATSGGAQHGLSFDAWGRKFLCSNSDHLQQVVYEDRYLARNPYFSAPSSRRSIAADGPAADVFRISPIEPWRIVRTRLRVQGLVPGPIEGGGTPAGYFTGATGTTVYRGDAWPEAFRGNVFIADVGSNLVHRKILNGDGVVQEGVRAEENTEFLRSSDIWFRPVQFANGPDGTLYVLDMSREIVEHPDSLPPIIKQHLDLNSGNDQGRIYRIVPKGFQQPKITWPGEVDTAGLVAMLAHPNGWHRETASRLLYERQDPDAIPALEALAAGAESDFGRMHALYALEGLGALRAEIVQGALHDRNFHVRQHAARLSEPFLRESAPLAEAVAALTEDSSELVRYQAAFSAGYLPDRANVLTAILQREGGNEWIRMAALSSAMESSALILALLFAAETPPETGVVDALALQAGGFSDIDSLKVLLESDGFQNVENVLAESTVRGLLQGLKLSGRPAVARNLVENNEITRVVVARSIESAVKVLQSADGKMKERGEAVQNLGFADFETAGPVLLPLLAGNDHDDVKRTVLSIVSQYEDPSVAEAVLEVLDGLSPQLREAGLNLLFARPVYTMVLLKAMEEGRFPADGVNALRRAMLLNHADGAIQAKAAAVFAASPISPRDEIVARYQRALTLDGDAARGKALFTENCSQCHRVGEVGYHVGPDLSSFASRGAEQIVLNVLDPNRELNPQYLNYVIETTDWESYSGIISGETANSVTLRRGHGVEDTLLRVNIESMKSTALSLMPEGFEASITEEGMADLIAFLMNAGRVE